MKSYLVKLVFNIDIDNGKNASQFDEQTRLINAKNTEEAFFKARNIGKQEESSFLSKDKKKVSWKFIDVADLYELQNIKDGEQLYATTHERTDADSFIEFVKRKSMVIQAKSLTFA
jgi:hypothetical protein